VSNYFGSYFGDTGSASGTYTDPGVGNVRLATTYTFNSVVQTGTLALPAEADVEEGVQYGAAGTEFTGTLDAGGELPAERDVRAGVSYGSGGTEFTGTLIVAGATVTAVSPVHATTRRMVINAGDDYDSANDTLVPMWSSSGWPDLTGASAEWVGRGPAKSAVRIDVTLDSVGGDSQTVSLDPLSRDDTALLPGYTRYEVVATLANGDVVTIVPESELRVEP
jgi:hypothetical protein